MNMSLLFRFAIACKNILFVFASAAVFPDIFAITSHKTPDNKRVEASVNSSASF